MADERTIHFLNYKNLVTIPDEVLDDPQVYKLYLKRNLLRSLPCRISQLQNLFEINLDSNLVETLPDEIRYLHNLQILDLKSNKLSQIPDGIFELKSLRTLNLYSNNITYIGKGIKQLKRLESLVLTSNNLHQLPKELFHCSSLKYLDLDSNHLNHIPKGFQKLENLETISLSCNNIKFPSLNISNLKQLKYINVYDNEILCEWMNNSCQSRSDSSQSDQHLEFRYLRRVQGITNEEETSIIQKVRYCYGLTLHYEDGVESLLELSARQMFESRYNVTKNTLPQLLLDILDCASCFCMRCLKPIFTWAVYSRLMGNGGLKDFAVFCSSNCRRKH